MSGGPPPPYNIHSPSQQHRYTTTYSPPNRSVPYYPNNDQYHQHSPPAPPAFSPHPTPFAGSSPRYVHPSSPLSTTLPPLNGSVPPPPPPPTLPHPDAHQFLPHPPTTPHQLPMPHPYSVLSRSSPVSFSHSSPSHAHPVSVLEAPLRVDREPGLDVRPNGGLRGYSPHFPDVREHRVSRPPSPPPPEPVRIAPDH